MMVMTMIMADKYDDDENVRALDQLNTFPFYGIIGINRILCRVFCTPVGAVFSHSKLIIIRSLR